jgi:hypothetical protein
LDPFTGLYIRTANLVQGILIVTSILRPFVGASSSSSSTLSPGWDSSDDYPEIRASTFGNSIEDDCLNLMMAPNGDQSPNSSSGYPTIGRSEASDARTPSVGLVQNLKPNFNTVRVQAIMETIQRMAPDGSSLVVLTQQGAEAMNLVVAEKSANVAQKELSSGHNDWASIIKTCSRVGVEVDCWQHYWHCSHWPSTAGSSFPPGPEEVADQVQVSDV